MSLAVQHRQTPAIFENIYLVKGLASLTIKPPKSYNRTYQVLRNNRDLRCENLLSSAYIINKLRGVDEPRTLGHIKVDRLVDRRVVKERAGIL